MTEIYGSDGRAITNNQNGNQPEAGALQAQANNIMCQKRPGLGEMLTRMAQARPAAGVAQQGRMDYSQGTPANGSLAVPELYGTVEFTAGLGSGGVQVPSNTDAYSLFQPTVQRHGDISWQNGRPVWKDRDYRNMPAIYGEVEQGTNNLKFNIDVPTNTANGMRRDTITVKHGQNSDGSIQAEMVSTYPYGRFQTAPRAMYSGVIQMVREVQPQMQTQSPQQQNANDIGSVMPGTPVYSGGMDQSQGSMTGNMRTETNMGNGGDPQAVIAAQQRQIQELQQQNQQMQNNKEHPIRDGLLGLGMVGVGAALQFGKQYMYGRGMSGGYYNRGIPFVNGGSVPFFNNRRNRR